METISTQGYASNLQFSCKECGFQSKFNTSARLGIPNDGNTRPFDINRRMVYAFSAMGKGLRGLDIFSMHINMKAIQSKSFNAHKIALLDVATQNVIYGI